MINIQTLPTPLLEVMSFEQVDTSNLLPDTEGGLTICPDPKFYAVFSNGFGETYLLTGRSLGSLKNKIMQLADLTDEPDLKIIYDVKLGMEIPATYSRHSTSQLNYYV